MDEATSAQANEAEPGHGEGLSTFVPSQEDYFYMPLKKNEVRLLELLPGEPEDAIRCRFHVVSIDTEDFLTFPLPYAALSYTWGDDNTEKTVLVDGKPITLKPNLEAALLEFRRQPVRLPPLHCIEKLMAGIAELRSLILEYHEQRPRKSNTPDQLDVATLHQLESDLWASLERATDNTAERLIDMFIAKAEIWWNRIALREGMPKFSHARRYLWVDGLCINQKDFKERAIQIQLMAKIYSKASLLVIWLGSGLSADMETHHDAIQVFDQIGKRTFGNGETMRSVVQNWMKEVPCEGAVRTSITRTILMMFQSPWLYRAWIVQEYILESLVMDRLGTARILTCCGSSRFRNFFSIGLELRDLWYDIPERFELFEDTNDISVVKAHSNARSLMRARRNYRKILDKEPQKRCGSPQFMLLKLVAEAGGQRLATNPRDIIYSMFGLVDRCFGEDGKGFTPGALVVDYDTSIEVVFSSFIKEIVVNTKRLDVLAFCYGERVKRSWSPDWYTLSWQHQGPLAAYIRTSSSYEYAKGFPFDTTPEEVCDAQFSDDFSTLTSSGFIWEILAERTISVEAFLLRSVCRTLRDESLIRSTSQL